MKTIIIIFTIFCLTGCYGKSPEKTGKEGKPLPLFHLLLQDSSTWLNSTDIPKGKPFGIFVFSPFCPFCRAQTQEIIDHIKDLKDVRFYFVSSFPMPLLKGYYNEYQLSKYPNITLGRDTANEVAKYFDIKGIPYLAIYGKEKKLNHSFMGKISSDQIEEVIKD